MLEIILITIILLALAFAGFAIKMFFQKDGEFKKSCGSMDPTTGRAIGCSCGNAEGGKTCENKNQLHFQPVEIKE